MTQLEMESYAVGTNVAGSLVNTNQEFDLAALFDAIKDVIEGNDLKLSHDEINKYLTEFGQKVQSNQQEIVQKVATENAEKGKKYLEDNKAKDGVVVTESGLQYEVLQEGSGEKPGTDSKVKVHYAGTTIDGVEFDSSYKRGEPIEFPVTGVIPGWTEALQLMNVGSKFRLTIPSDLAYGAQGAGQSIGPNETLCFDVELLAIA